MEPIPFLGSLLNGAAASEKMHISTMHLLKGKQFEIAVLPPGQAEVLMEKCAFVARQKSTQELERLRDYLHHAIQALEFKDPSKPCLDILSVQAFCGQAS